MLLLAAVFGAGCSVTLITANLRSPPPDVPPVANVHGIFFTPRSGRVLVNLSGAAVRSSFAPALQVQKRSKLVKGEHCS